MGDPNGHSGAVPLQEAVELATKVSSCLMEISYRGIPLGIALRVVLFSEFVQGGLSQNSRPRPQSKATLPIIAPLAMALKASYTSRKALMPSHAGMLLDAASGSRNTEMIDGLAERFKGKAVRLSGDYGGTPFAHCIRPAEIPVDIARWLTDVLREEGRRRRLARQICDHLQLRSENANRLGFLLTAASLTVARMHRLWDLVQPKALVVVSDWEVTASILCLLARRHKIPSITLQHGVFDESMCYGVIPLLADYMFVWGRYHSRAAQELGVGQSHIRITGYPRLLPAEPEPAEAIARKIGMSTDGKHVVCLGLTSCLTDEQLRNILAVFLGALDRQPGWHGIIRPHPVQPPADIHRILGSQRSGAAQVLPAGSLTVAETARICQAMVVAGTGLGLDALFYGCSVIGLDIPKGSYTGYLKDLAEGYSAAYTASDEAGLADCLASIQTRDERYEKIRASATLALPHFFALAGSEADTAAYEEIGRLMGQPASLAGATR